MPGLDGLCYSEQTSVIWHIRMPRTLVGLLVGAALAVSGAVMQGVFGNSLADPGIIGVSSGAALGAVIAIALGVTANGIFYMPVFALTGALLAVGLTVVLAMRDGKIPVMVLLLAGVAVSMLMGALTSGILTFMNENRLREFLFWVVGGLDYRRWEHVYLAAGPIIYRYSYFVFIGQTSQHYGFRGSRSTFCRGSSSIFSANTLSYLSIDNRNSCMRKWYNWLCRLSGSSYYAPFAWTRASDVITCLCFGGRVISCGL